MPDSLPLPIRPDWDTTSAYDSLYENSGARPVFVGRETLIEPLVAEIAEPDKRGTYLISGYRGTGKTTLLIEALTRAKDQLTNNKHTLFPVVLNVSEVSASLGNSSEATPVALNIDPRRLLIALIRQMRDGISRVQAQTPLPNKRKDAIDKLAGTITDTYEKATAAKFSMSATNSQENTRARSREFTFSLDDKNVLATVAALAGAGAVAFESAAWFKQFTWLHAAAAWLASIAAVGLIASYKRSQSEKSTNARQRAVEWDNSLQQLETDLKDILTELKKNGFRTVVVLEELDKIVDPKGLQLAAVIRYFKNLFTQAPALFFFVTDKSYFDIVASAIKRARRARSYAVEHTFFTHRIFVGRPTTDECLRFIASLTANEADKKKIEAVGDTLGKPGRFSDADRLGRFIRIVLFAAANHMFDLKNELRLFARNEAHQVDGQTFRTSSFLIDEQTLPPEREALAVFQDLIVEKSKLFEIKGGRAYANETLADSLYAIFNELGSTQPQKIDSFLPVSNPGNKDGLLLDEQLDLSEAARVRQAVQSLIADLERGGALASRDENTFTWRDDAAREFRYIRQLQTHEETLIAELQKNAALANALVAGGDTSPPHYLAVELNKRVAELRQGLDPLPADAAAEEQRKYLDSYRKAFVEAMDARLKDLTSYGFTFESLAQGLGGSLHLVKPKFGDPRVGTNIPRGAVLLAFGDSETLEADVSSFVAPSAPSLIGPNRLGLVHVIHTTGDITTEIDNRKKRWSDALAKHAEIASGFRYAVEVVPLVYPKGFAAARADSFSEVQRTAALLAELGLWARPESRPYESLPIDTPPLTQSLRKWLASDDAVFHIDGSTVANARTFAERDDLEVAGTAVLGLTHISKSGHLTADIAITCMLKGFEYASGPPEQWSPLGEWLLETDRVILYVDWDRMLSWTTEDLLEALEAGAAMIIAKAESLPPGFEKFGVVKAPAPTSD